MDDRSPRVPRNLTAVEHTRLLQELAAHGLVEPGGGETLSWRLTQKGADWGEALHMLGTYEDLVADGDMRLA